MAHSATKPRMCLWEIIKDGCGSKRGRALLLGGWGGAPEVGMLLTGR